MARKPTSTPAPNILDGYDPNDPASKDVVKSKVIDYLKLLYLQMNRAQQPFIRIKNKFGRTPRTRLFESGNQVGKCVCYQQLIETTSGEKTVGELYEAGLPFEVWSWDGNKRVPARASVPFKKPGLHQCYRITMSDGRTVEAADHHRILCDDGYRFVSDLLESSSVRGLSVRASGEICYPKKPSGFLGHCSSLLRRCGERLRSFAGGDQVFSPSPSGARLHTDLQTPRSGVQVGTRTCNPFGQSLLLANSYVLPLSVGRFVASSGLDAVPPSQWYLGELQSYLQLCAAEGRHLRSFYEYVEHPRRSGSVSSSSKPPKYGNYIESITPITGLKEVYDFEVETYHNYYAAGLIHHNTSIGVAEDIAHAMGFRPWLNDDDPDYKIHVRVPNNGLVGCEVAGQTLAQRIEPEFMSLIPDYCGVSTTRYSDGSIKSLTLTNDFNGKPCGSTIHFRSYVQPADSYEGVVLDWIHFDEPPPQDILTAATRGLMSTNGPSWYTMTPLKEAYIYDLLSIKAFNNGGDDQDIAVFRGSTWDNCQDWCRLCDVTIPENAPEVLKPGQPRPIHHCPKCGQLMGFLPRAGIENYLKKITDPDEREAREEGKWKHLSGLVYKQLDRNVHLYDDFPIPKDWMRIECVDPADARPTRWIFGAVSPEDILINGRNANRIYWYAYLLPQGSIESIARAVKVKRAEHGYKEPAMVIIDVKFAAAHKPLHGETAASWEEKLSDAGIHHMVMSCSNPGDVALGHKMVKEYLNLHYSPVRGYAFPGMMFAKEGCKGDRGPIQDMFNYQWKMGTDKPEEAYKDFPDTIRYAALEQPRYEPPKPEIDPEFARMILERQNMKQEPNPLFHGLAMRS